MNSYMINQAPPPIELPPPPPCPSGTIYTVRPGDTMFRIANEFGIPLTQLIAVNPQVTNPNIIIPGQQLCIPAEVVPPPPPEFCPVGTVYIVQPGDSLFDIARRFSTSVQQLIAANPQIPDPNVIRVGERICIPIDGIPLPTDFCKADLIPVSTALGGTAFINEGTPTLWIATFGLPAPAEIGPQYCTYVAWVYNPIARRYVCTRLQPTGVMGIEAGYKRFTELITFEGFREIIVTAEPRKIPDTPTGPVVLKGRIVC